MKNLFDFENNFKNFCGVFCVCSLIFGVCEDVEAARVAPDAAAALAHPQDQQQIHAVVVTPAEGSTVITRADVERCGAHHATAIEIPANVTEIGNRAFCSSDLQTVTFLGDSQLTTIGSEAFAYCTWLGNIDIPKNVTTIGNKAFFDCVDLQTVTFPGDSQLTTIGSEAFAGCTNLESITNIPNSINSAGVAAFVRSNQLKLAFVKGEYKRDEYEAKLRRILNSSNEGVEEEEEDVEDDKISDTQINEIVRRSIEYAEAHGLFGAE